MGECSLTSRWFVDKHSKSRGLKAIAGLDLQPIVRDLKRDGWDDERIALALTGYSAYLTRTLLDDDFNDNPLKDVDAVWHYHILRTQKYFADCEAVFGYYLHHFPDKPVPDHQLADCGSAGGQCASSSPGDKRDTTPLQYATCGGSCGGGGTGWGGGSRAATCGTSGGQPGCGTPLALLPIPDDLRHAILERERSVYGHLAPSVF